MINLVTIISTSVDNLKRRLPKFYRFGKRNAETAVEVNPYGIDSNAIEGMVAVYAQTTNNGAPIVIGYINKNQQALVGELRTFSTDKDGNEKFYTWLRNDGTYEIGGTSNYAVKFNELKTEFNSLKSDFNSLVTKYNSHTHTGVTSGSGSSGTTATPATTNSSNIDNAKNDKIKTI